MDTTFLNRRAFLERLGQLGFTALGAGLIPLLPLSDSVAAPEPRPLAEAKGSDPAALVREVVGKLGGMTRFVKQGQNVVVKPNLGWDRTVEEAANTHPAVVAEVCRLALQAGARQVRVFDRTCNDARRTYERSGMRDAISGLRDERVRLEFVDEGRFEVVALERAAKLTTWPIYRPALEADVLINVPVVKHHGLSGVTVAMKNLMGIMGGNRGRIHQDIEDGLSDINAAVRSHLVVVDATRILLKNGPQGGGTKNVRNAEKVAATTDVVTADAWGAREFGVDALSIGTIRRAVDRGLGIADLGKVRIL